MRLLGIFLVAVSVVAGADDCPSGDKKSFAMLGCYQSTQGNSMIFSDRSNINWGNIEKYMHKLACQCGKRAKEANYAGFSLMFYGECHGKTKEQLEELESRSHQQNLCVGDQKYTHCDKGKHEHCTGKEFAEGVFKFKSPEEKIDGGYGPWEPIGTCSKSCGRGEKLIIRRCENPKPAHGGKDCSKLGETNQTVACNLKPCPVDGGYGPWSSYGSCSVSCGTGTKTRTRSCNSPLPAYNGTDCSKLGPARQSAECSSKPCGITTPSWSRGDGTGGPEENIGKVSNKEECIAKCLKKSRNGKPANGATVDAATEKSCYCEYGQTGRNSASSWKNTFIRPIDGGYGSWSKFGSCSKTCGGGTKSRSRPCNNPAPLMGGESCSRLGSATESASCNTFACPSSAIKWERGDGTGGSEVNIGKVTNAAECVAKCSSRKKNGKLANGATVDAATQKRCYCEFGQTGRNSAASWRNTFIRPLDGGYGSWSNFGSCSKTCGGGTKSRSRPCNNPAPLMGGKDCSRLGSATESAPCNTFACPSSAIKWERGDGTGGSEVNIGKVTNAAECVAKCSSRKKNGKLANGATVDAATQKRCYCEFGQTGRNSAASWRNTFIRPLDGGYGSWSNFGSCSKTCGGGTKSRSRPCNNPAPLMGGKDCSRLGSATESASCNTFACPSSAIKWERGDGTGGSEVNIGKVTNAAECVAKCSSRKKNGKLANGATVDAATQKRCYCEFGQTGRNSAASWQNTFIRPLDGGYGSWSNFGSCSKTCGGGTKSRSRPCNNPSPLMGGKSCSRLGPATESAPCNTFACPSSAIKWERGDGTGGSEVNIGKVTNAAECVAKCSSRKKNGKLANGATVDAATQKRCYCEFGQTGRNSAASWRNTFIRP
ncbi:SCO-spondin-like isoform X2 [Rhopilema esculentum]|uniref:SCO-spondin-like isoform X2 n=1 Tax=Rhopilema esculentum TaxID=499914 RepID=UPI0031DA5332